LPKNILNLSRADSFFASGENTEESDVDILVSFHDLSIDCIVDRCAYSRFWIPAFAGMTRKRDFIDTRMIWN